MTTESIDLTKQALCFAEKQPGVIGVFKGDAIDFSTYIYGDARYITNEEVAILYTGGEGSYNELALAYAKLFAAAPKLLAACKKVVELLDSGVLVRNIANDGEPDWSINALSLVVDLNQIQQAIVLAEAA